MERKYLNLSQNVKCGINDKIKGIILNQSLFFSTIGHAGKKQTNTSSLSSAGTRAKNKIPFYTSKGSNLISSWFSPKTFSFAEVALKEDLGDRLKSAFYGKMDEKEEKKSRELFSFMLKELMKTPGKFTYGVYLNYYRNLCEYMGVTGLKSKLPGKSKNAAYDIMRNELSVLESMIPDELESDSPDIFTRESKALIAEAARVKVKFVERVLLNHDILKTDRTWYMRRILFGRALPATFQDRELEAETDRPRGRQLAYGETQHTVEAVWSSRMMDKRWKTKTWRPKSWAWFRKPSSGINRWRNGVYTKKYVVLRMDSRKTPNYLHLSKNPVRKRLSSQEHY